MTENPVLECWQAVCDSPVIGRVGHRLTQEPGPAHPVGPAPAWVTAHGCDLAALHVAHIAHVLHDRRGEDRECAAGAACPYGPLEALPCHT